MRGGEKLEPSQSMLPGLQREQQRPPHHHLHPPPPHRAWEQLGQLYESHLPPQGHPVVPLTNEHSLRLHNGGYAGSGRPPPNSHLPHGRPNQLLKVKKKCYRWHHDKPVHQQFYINGKITLFTLSVVSLLLALVWGSSGATCSPGSTTAGRWNVGSGAPGRSPLIGFVHVSSSIYTEQSLFWLSFQLQPHRWKIYSS